MSDELNSIIAEIEEHANVIKEDDFSVDDIVAILYYHRSEGYSDAVKHTISDIEAMRIEGDDEVAKLHFADFIFEISTHFRSMLSQIDLHKKATEKKNES